MTIALKGEDFNEFYYKHDCGIPYERNDHWINFFDQIAKKIIDTLNPKKVLDAGCAWGFLVEALRKRGVEAYGVDISGYAISNVAESIKPFCRIGSISEPFDQHYDLVVSIEVLEHMPSDEAQKAIDNFCLHSDCLLFSSTPFDYKEVTHINVHLPEYWAGKFAAQGFFRDLDYDASFITAWAALYTKRNLSKDRIVYEYERSLWPLFKEKYDLRQRIAENQSDIEEIETSRDAAILEVQHNRELLTTHENLIISKDAELEALKDTVVNHENLITSKDAELEALKDTIVNHENLITSKDAELEALKDTVATFEARFQEINSHWSALVNSKTWKTLQKLGRFKDFPDLST